ncbi:hydroxymethylpyrimidine/phosphomethylpyrimidine kinase [Leuconostoc koreense]|nr:hydroxymethylpyrimidine/phosphomethylpyrimidine kinase [Leuconostoc mesenteroides]QGM24998.1 hydroxymethylpyrimidine/phosphomethylpyrimidine kinase [Leuconostoc mesenteroides subsp. mesenteroides]
MNKILSIGGSDTSGGGGIEADIRTFEKYNIFNLVAIENIVTMAPQTWAVTQYTVPNNPFAAQLQTAMAVDLAGMKVGMVSDIDNFNTLVDYLENMKPSVLLVDPVMATKLSIDNDCTVNLETYKEKLLAKADIITPNILEAAMLTGVTSISNISEMKVAAEKLFSYGIKYIVIKSGNRFDDNIATDLLYDGVTFDIFQRKIVATDYNHGAGCTFSAAILANIVKGLSIHEAVLDAKNFTFQAIENAVRVNQFVGHVWQGENGHETTK